MASSAHIHDAPLNDHEKERHFLAYMIVYSLRRYGCEDESISRVVQSYRLGDTMDRVVRSLDSGQTRDWPAHVDRITHVRMESNQKRRTDRVFASDWFPENPHERKTGCHRLPHLTPAESVIIQAADGRTMGTTVTSEAVWYHLSAKEENEPLSTDLVDFPMEE